MDKNNIFDLSNKYKKNDDIDNNDKSDFSGFVKIDKSNWNSITDGTIIKYIRKDGVVVKGGILKYQKNTDTNNPAFCITAGYDKRKGNWCVYYNSISEVWIKNANNLSNNTNKSFLDNNIDENKKIKNFVINLYNSIKERDIVINKLTQRIEKMEIEQNKFKQFIKELYNIEDSINID